MTQHKHLKRLVRERQARTGESYMAALHHVRGARQTIPVEELIDLSELAAALQLTCRAVITPALAARVDVGDVLRRLRTVLRDTMIDPAFDVMRAAALHGEARQAAVHTFADRAFLARVHAGLGGVSSDGRLLALPVSDGTLAIVYLWTLPVPYSFRPATLIIAPPGGLLADMPHLGFRGLR